jgi:ribonuclease HI
MIRRMPQFTCQACGAEFSLSEAVLAKFPGWQPRQCMACKNAAKPGTGSRAGRPARKATSRPTATATELLEPGEILKRYTLGPTSGVFTDGGAMPNPGPGGWGVVWVEDDVVLGERHGHDPDTTNNRMELTALWEALKLVPAGTPVTVHSDSELVVNTFTKWASSWKRNGWKRKTGAIKNLDLVQEIHEAISKRPEVSLIWVPAHAGWRWNEYADALAGNWARKKA